MVAITTGVDGYTIIDLLCDWNIEVWDSIVWANGPEVYQNVTKGTRAEVYVQNHAVDPDSLRQQLLYEVVLRWPRGSLRYLTIVLSIRDCSQESGRIGYLEPA